MEKVIFYFALIGVGTVALTALMVFYIIYSAIYDHYIERRHD